MNKIEYNIFAWVEVKDGDEFYPDKILVHSYKKKEDAIAAYNNTPIGGVILELLLVEDDGENVRTLMLKDETGEYDDL